MRKNLRLRLRRLPAGLRLRRDLLSAVSKQLQLGRLTRASLQRFLVEGWPWTCNPSFGEPNSGGAA
jgi:hypothetical protein